MAPLPLHSPSPLQVLISKYGEVNDAEYLDPRGNCVIQFDHIKQAVAGSRAISGELDQEVEGYRCVFLLPLATLVPPLTLLQLCL